MHSNLIKDLESSLDKYMKNLPESPLLLPIKTKIYIERKNVTVDHLAFNPTDSTDKLYDVVVKYFTNLGDEIDFKDSAFYITRKDYEMDINSQMSIVQKDMLIQQGQKFLSTGLVTGEVIVLKGGFTFKSEAPKACLTYEFEKSNYLNSKVNYFSCDSCKLNWICNVCVESCHKGHSVKLYIENHTVTWACCYCYKNKCLVKNNKYNN